MHTAANLNLCRAHQLLLSKAHRPKTSWVPGFKCLGGNFGSRYQRQTQYRGSHEPQVPPPRLLRGSTGPHVADPNTSSPTTTALPQIVLSSRRRPAHQPASAVRGADLHRELQTHSAVDWVGESGQTVVTGHVVFGGDETEGVSPGTMFMSARECQWGIGREPYHTNAF
jgi:hypothetical protein